MEEETNLEVEAFEFPAKEVQTDHYELTVLVVNLTDDAAAGIFKDVKEYVTSFGGEITYEEDMGRRKLAYQVAGSTSGNYIVLEFDLDRPKLAELNEKLRITKAVTRYLIVKRPKRTAEEIAAEATKREVRLAQGRKPKEEEEKKSDRRSDRPARRPQAAREPEETKPAKPQVVTEEVAKDKPEEVKADEVLAEAKATDAPDEEKKPLADIDSEIEKLLSDEVDV
ncbi:MAG: 30S ribosomal protein S6 [Candidatus Kerfeldbacteria bacterium CG15_BIG_FIL_POST_REV_8_21_14_020_45_12]|uniref:Small ribosomal subunit protein bS6 n=1 Tax=Candidatus Kerfeldbacteria bacterium CG15_BIG_FIL_POST_REV_8_21_14_020_45_12 TaxID=2014247 RepID=A0A2M7H2D0_9BACT|nr:MAG: 30S ribosomal protein S6 [Candidatus Kerfeldbacteria bacterium CG15_BIG_FIL_POST_REV_8_21_14_020_45_12]PJA93909.1 MAG: 30S ribosomal protein S6 [Candidatus Kerfeldbacteria bacterium CG_4_9_14_3_um_filter_45_8]